MVYLVKDVDHVMLLNMNDFVEILNKNLVLEYLLHLMMYQNKLLMSFLKIFQDDYLFLFLIVVVVVVVVALHLLFVLVVV